MIRIVMDAFGGDNAPQAVVEGAVMALSRYDDIAIALSGAKAAIEAELARHTYDNARMSIIDAPEVIGMHEQPTLAIKRKRDSSLVKALYAVADGEADCIVSAGSTGALMAGATLIIRRMENVKRPALGSLIPTPDGMVMLIDCGANTDSKPSYLVQFAIMGSAYMKNVAGVESPRVGLLNNGSEPEKGNELTKAAFKLLSEAQLNFVGNCEGRDILSGDYDVVVCDGFDGNIVLKYTEGLAKTILDMLKAELMADPRSKLGAHLARNAFRRFKKKMDYTEYGGAPLLGVKGGVIKAHGSSDAKAFASALMQARNFINNNVNPAIMQTLADLPDTED